MHQTKGSLGDYLDPAESIGVLGGCEFVGNARGH